MTIAERLVAARGDIPRKTVANAVGISISALTMYEIGERIPRDEIKVRIANYYGRTVQSLFLKQIVTISDLTKTTYDLQQSNPANHWPFRIPELLLPPTSKFINNPQHIENNSQHTDAKQHFVNKWIK